MSFLGRLSNVFKGLVEEKLSAVEADNPDAVYASAIEAAELRIGDTKDRLVGLMAQQQRRGDDTELGDQVVETRMALDQQRQELETLKVERTRALAQRELAAAQVAVNDLKQGLSADADIQAVGNVRSDIERTYERAHEGWLDSEGRPVHARVEQLAKKSAEDKAREELARLKAARDGEPEPVAEGPDEPDEPPLPSEEP
jgi:phage shock protein A